ncbi:MAG: MBL fold metallo-hydrolase [Kiritimatiellae bacterium]|nr:MBL fold metallo-hydrolase [Kiritimatiellia bacterium]
MKITKRAFLKLSGCAAAGIAGAAPAEAEPQNPSPASAKMPTQNPPATSTQASQPEEPLDMWERETNRVTPQMYSAYLRDGNTRGLFALEKLEESFEKMLRGIAKTKVEGAPAVWSVYNMGYVVKTKEALFSIDLVHRRAAELAPRLDFELVTHNHGDHFRADLYSAMNGAGKTVISNFLDNYGAADWRKGGQNWMQNGGYTRAKKTFKIKDVEIRTSLIDHNNYLVDFTTAFEIRVGNFIIYHTGDSGSGSEKKVGTTWGRPDLWLFFPGCGIDVAEAVRKVQPKKVVFGHLWELGHKTGRLKAAKIRRSKREADPLCPDVSVAFWGDRIL